MSLQTVGSLGYGGEHLNTDLPKILIELQSLTISGPIAGAGSGVALPVADKGGILIEDTLVKVLSVVTATGVWTDQTAVASIVDLRASGTLTIGAVVAGDTVTVDGRVYTFTAIQMNNSTNLAPGVVPIGVTAAVTAANLAQAINSQDDTVIATAGANVVTVQAAATGVAGNAIGISASNGDVVAAPGATLAGGSATNAINIAAVTTGSQVFVVWFEHDRNLLQP
jgi:hypothetical protein